MVGVADGQRECVGSVEPEPAFDGEQRLDHVLDLFLLGGARAGDRELDLARSIFEHVGAAAVQAAQRRTAGLAELQGAVGIAVHEHPLDRDLARRVFAHQAADLQERDVLFVDEIHRLSPVVEEILYPAMEDYQLDIMIGDGPAARSIKLDLPPFTLVGATTRAGLLTSPLRDRFGIVQRLEFYSVGELTDIVTRSAAILGLMTDPAGAERIARRARGTPRIANRLLRRVRDFAEVKADGRITDSVAEAALDMLDVDRQGFDVLDRRLLLTVLEKFEGGPVGVDSLAAAVGEEGGTLEDVVEPYLIQQGYLARTARGRIATRAAWLHFGLTPPEVDPGGSMPLFGGASGGGTLER